jgi:hypothetical protein
MLRSLRTAFPHDGRENNMLDELPGGSKDAGRRAQDAQQRREKERIRIIAMRSSSVLDIARSA